MIRVNLLNPLATSESRVDALVRTGGGSAFIARREVLLGFLCLAIAATALFFQLQEPSVDAAGAPAPDAPLVAEASPIIEIDKSEAPPAQDPEAVVEKATPDEESISPEDGGGGPAELDEPTAASDEPTVARNETPDTQETAARTPEPQADASPPSPTPSTGAALSQLAVSSQGNSLRIFAATGNQPQYKTFRLDRPHRIVVDLPGVRLALPRQQYEQTAGHPQVQRIRAGLYQANPPQTRIVLDVTTFPEVEILPQFNGLYIVVTERAQ